MSSLILLFFSILYMPFATANEPQTCEELLKFNFDGRNWEKTYENNSQDSFIMEFTLKGESIDSWSELVTVQRFPNLQASLNEYFSLFEKKLQELAYPNEAHIRIIDKNPSDLLVEWWIGTENPLAQHEWMKIFKTSSSIMLLRYTTKQIDEVEKVRKTWEAILNQARILTKGECR